MPKSQTRSKPRTQQSQGNTQLTGCSVQLTLGEAWANIDDQVNNCVRYILQKAGHKVQFRKSDLQKNVVSSSSRNFEVVIQKAKQILRDVYGFNLLLCEGNSSNRLYILSNALPYIDDNAEDSRDEPPEDCVKILLMLILSHIFMFSAPVGEASLNAFLLNLGIDVEKNHPLFGSVKTQLNTIIKQKYLHVENDPLSKKSIYSWGSRANAEISKHAVLSFVCKMYKNCSPSAWTNQFKMADEQGFENTPLVDNDMVVDE